MNKKDNKKIKVKVKSKNSTEYNSKLDILQEYKDLYYREIEFTDRLNSKVSICLTMLTVAGSIIGLELSNLKNLNNAWYTTIYFHLCILICLSFMFCFYKFIKMYIKVGNPFLSIDKTAKYINKVYKEYDIQPYENAKVDDYISLQLANSYISYASTRRKNNEELSDRYRKFIISIIICAFIIFFTYLWYIGCDYYESINVKEGCLCQMIYN